MVAHASQATIFFLFFFLKKKRNIINYNALKIKILLPYFYFIF
jgi:hypothetical protein